MARQFYVYILASHKRAIYVGVTNDLERRLWEHRNGVTDGFTKRYQITKLVHYEFTGSAITVISREKEIKGWRRAKKIQLIEATNPEWQDLTLAW